MKKNILVLVDRMGLRDSLMNLGDKALTDGLYAVLGDITGCPVISGGWKNFPFVCIKDFEHVTNDEEIENVFDRYVTKITAYSSLRRHSERIVVGIMERIRLFLWPGVRTIDRVIRKHYSIGLYEIIIPRLFPAHTAGLFIDKVKSANVVVANIAGLISDNLLPYIPMHLFECYCARKMGKPVILVNQTVDGKSELLRRIVSFIYLLMNLHTTREPCSKQYLIERSIPEANIISSCDSAFAAPYEQQVQNNVHYADSLIKEGDIGIVLRGDRPIDIERWAALIGHLERTYRVTCWIIHTCWARDYKRINKLKRRSTIRELPVLSEYADVVTIMKKCSIIISDRYHASIFAIMAGTPVVPVSPETSKVNGLFSIFEYPVDVLPPLRDETFQLFCETISRVVQEKENIEKLFARIAREFPQNVRRDMERALSELQMNNR